MVEKIKNNKFVFFCALIFLIIFCEHFFMNYSIGDDGWFTEYGKMNLLDYLSFRYTSWTSRLVIESVLVTMLKLPRIVFMVINSCMFVLMYYSSIRITNTEKNEKALILLFVLYITFPIKYFGSAGWYATMINYSWPLGLGLYCLYLICKSCIHEKLSMFQKVVFFPAYIYAVNQEQLCALIFGFTFVLIIYTYFKEKKINRFLILSCALALMMLAFHGLCPGNELRKISETKTFYPEFAKFTFIDKVVLGVASTFSIMITKPLVIIFAFLFSIVICAYRKNDKIAKIISWILFAIYLALVAFILLNRLGINLPVLARVTTIIQMYTGNIPEIVLGPTLILYILCSFVFVLAVLYCLYRTLDKENFTLVGIIFLASLAARFILGLSASIFASSYRTFINTYYLQMICVLVMVFNHKPLLFKKSS